MTPEELAANDFKAEGIKKGAFARVDPSPLPQGEKFLFWIDEEGDYIVQAQRENRGEFLSADGATIEDAVWAMRETLDMAASAQAKLQADASPSEPQEHGDAQM
jgi:hypothetical protein